MFTVVGESLDCSFGLPTRELGDGDHEPLFYSNTGILPGKVPMITEPAVVMIDMKPCPLMTRNFATGKEEQAKQVVLIER